MSSKRISFYGNPHCLHQLRQVSWYTSRCHRQPLLRSSAVSMKRCINGLSGPQTPSPTRLQPQTPEDVESSGKANPEDGERRDTTWQPTLIIMVESAVTTSLSLLVISLAGYSYYRYYKYLTLKKMEDAFKPGDPVLELAAMTHNKETANLDEGDEKHWIRRHEQEKIDSIINGTTHGQYHLLVGEKGTGKSSMLLDAMAKIAGEGVSMMEAHGDLEIFRIRLGRALNFEFHEDYVGSAFSIRGPRDTTPLLDIERAFNKLEKIALRRRDRVGRPLILIINSVHLLREDEDGQDMLELIQQRAEQWAASNLVTVVLNSDDYWVYERLKQYATRMKVLPVLDLPKQEAMAALATYRERYHQEPPPMSILEAVYEHVGGRLSYLNRVAKSHNMLETCEAICETEKTWFLSKCWILGDEMDDDVMDQQKYASAAMALAKALVGQEKELGRTQYHPEDKSHRLPEIPLHKARQIMTRADFIKDYDHLNIFTIDARANVRADSVPMMWAFREICSEDGFEEFLQTTLDRISAIESLGRTREIVAKDLVHGARYKITGRLEHSEGLNVEVVLPREDD